MTREQLGVLLDAKEKLCNSCSAVHCDTCYVPKLIEKHKNTIIENKTEAEWIESVCGFNINCSDNYHCSKCGNKERFCTRFCSSCGSPMKDHKGFYWRTT